MNPDQLSRDQLYDLARSSEHQAIAYQRHRAFVLAGDAYRAAANLYGRAKEWPWATRMWNQTQIAYQEAVRTGQMGTSDPRIAFARLGWQSAVGHADDTSRGGSRWRPDPDPTHRSLPPN